MGDTQNVESRSWEDVNGSMQVLLFLDKACRVVPRDVINPGLPARHPTLSTASSTEP